MKDLQKKIKYTFKDKKLLEQALTHKSYSSKNNENLEFLGDSVLSLSLSHLLMKKYPKWSEGQLSQTRSLLVSYKSLSDLALGLDLGSYIFMAEDELTKGVNHSKRILCCSMEALIGALFIDAGYKKADLFVKRLFKNYLEDKNWKYFYEKDSKTRLQEWMQKKHKVFPDYRLIAEKGPDHQKIFQIGIYQGDKLLAQGVGNTKKEAEQEAASKALEVLKKDKKNAKKR